MPSCDCRKILAALPLDDHMLNIRFADGTNKIYDCREIMINPMFHPLRTPGFFRNVRVDPGGYGISWNDEIDLSEHELWTNGREVPSNS